jgi:hypothetical protein
MEQQQHDSPACDLGYAMVPWHFQLGSIHWQLQPGKVFAKEGSLSPVSGRINALMLVSTPRTIWTADKTDTANTQEFNNGFICAKSFGIAIGREDRYRSSL